MFSGILRDPDFLLRKPIRLVKILCIRVNSRSVDGTRMIRI